MPNVSLRAPDCHSRRVIRVGGPAKLRPAIRGQHATAAPHLSYLSRACFGVLRSLMQRLEEIQDLRVPQEYERLR